jgi:hypothetical protein
VPPELGFACLATVFDRQLVQVGDCASALQKVLKSVPIPVRKSSNPNPSLTRVRLPGLLRMVKHVIRE